MQILIQYNVLFSCHAKKCWRIKTIKKEDNRDPVFSLLLVYEQNLILVFTPLYTHAQTQTYKHLLLDMDVSQWIVTE